MAFERAVVAELVAGCRRRDPLVQVLVGPRQVGKTTAAQQLVARLGWPHVWAAADAPLPPGPEWIESHWSLARQRSAPGGRRVLLVLDEVQKVSGWSEVVKRLWDEERRTGGMVLPVLLGSSALLVQRGVAESLAGRFFLHRCPHWSWPECAAAFGWSLPDWIYFGGYPGAAQFTGEEPAWQRYVVDSLIETVLARDVLQLQVITKPVLLRHLFALAAAYPAQILSYNKMLGQLHDAGNTTTLAGYLRLLEMAYLVSGLEVFSRGQPRKRGSSPKLILWNNALISAQGLRSRAAAVADGAWWGRLVENAVGANLLNGLSGPAWSVTYWREGDQEVDFVVAHGSAVWAVEVKSGRPGRLSGLAAFRARYPKAKALVLGGEGVPLEEFFQRPPPDWFR
ncbi:MAG: ATP-binding protein [Verrucomicrobia bacterium]|nr:ATP-binding protein [Verrucomicrobiota bacterium]MBM3864763.1 ATP-binding protein [Verrucomicrobiota bacterium]